MPTTTGDESLMSLAELAEALTALTRAFETRIEEEMAALMQERQHQAEGEQSG